MAGCIYRGGISLLRTALVTTVGYVLVGARSVRLKECDFHDEAFAILGGAYRIVSLLTRHYLMRAPLLLPKGVDRHLITSEIGKRFYFARNLPPWIFDILSSLSG